MALEGLAELPIVVVGETSCLTSSGPIGVLGMYMELLLGRGATECCDSGKRLASM